MFYAGENEKPLDRLCDDGGFCGIFRTIGIVGDSLSSGEFESFIDDVRGCHDFYEYSWGQFMARTIGSKVYNFSKGGMTAREFFESYGATSGCFGYEKLCQAYIVALGVNDANKMKKIGDVNEAYSRKGPDANDPDFLSYYVGIIKRLKARQPDAKIFLMTIPKSSDEITGREMNEKLDLMCDKICQLAEKFTNTYVIDLRKYAPEFDKKFRDTFFLGHMRPTGYMVIAKLVMSYIDYLIRKYPDEFSQVGFIGTPYKYNK